MEATKPKNRSNKIRKSSIEVLGMWKDKWPKEKSSVDIAKELRQNQWKRD